MELIIIESKPRPLLTDGKRSAGIRALLTGEASVGGASTTGASLFVVSVGGATDEASGGSWRPEELR